MARSTQQIRAEASSAEKTIVDAKSLKIQAGAAAGIGVQFQVIQSQSFSAFPPPNTTLHADGEGLSTTGDNCNITLQSSRLKWYDFELARTIHNKQLILDDRFA